MAIERKFIQDNIKKLKVKEYLEGELDRSGVGEINIQRTPQGTRVMVFAQRPGLVIGRRGMSIKKLTTTLEKDFRMENPQVEVNELPVPELNAQIMANSIASAIERGIHFRRAAYTTLRRIMEAGARGAQIKISGKLTGERSKSVKFTDGYLTQCGDPAFLYVQKAKAEASPKPGIIGVQVKIMPPGIRLPDEIEVLEKEEAMEKKEIAPPEIEKLVEEVEEELAVVDEGVAAVPKKIKVEKVKRKRKKKVPEPEIEEPAEEKEEETKAETPVEKKEEVKGEAAGEELKAAAEEAPAKKAKRAKPRTKKETGEKHGDTAQ